MYKKVLHIYQNNQVDLILYDYKYVFDNREKNYIYNSHSEKGYQKVNSKNIYKINGAVWNKIFKSDIIKTNKIFFNDKISYAEDLEFTLKYLICCKSFFRINEPLVNYYQREGSLGKSLYQLENLNIALKNLEVFIKKNLKLEEAEALIIELHKFKIKKIIPKYLKINSFYFLELLRSFFRIFKYKK